MPFNIALLALAIQTVTPVSGGAMSAPRSGALDTRTATASRATRPPVLDGRDDDEVWREALPITAFRQWQPTEDADPRFATEAKVVYDEHNIYVFVRAYDPHPDSILHILARRDTWTPSDRIGVAIDSYHDRRSGYEFWVNPAGVKVDAVISNDGDEDDAWDAVWDVASAVDSTGWTAEFRIPLSQLRYAPRDENVMGIMIMRDIQRYTERLSWPVLRRSRSGWPSQMGELHGLLGLPSPRRLEVAPYAVTKNVQVATSTGGVARDQQITGGADVKYGITSNLTVDATLNPDFGQVEADPGVLNLSAFETFFPERRPFFIEGGGTFRFNVNCSAVNCGAERLFYTRRIGRAPQLSDTYGDANSPTATTIIGAAKLTGQTPGGLTIGMLDAVTQHELGPQARTIEPLTNYLVGRLTQNFRHGESGVGAMLTATNRQLDQWSEPTLRRSAYVAGFDLRHRFLASRYQLTAHLDFSHVTGSPSAILATQTSSVHFFQRPDDGIPLDSARTSLGGDAEEIAFGKVGGPLTRFETSYLRRSPGFEINDLGYLRRSDQQSWNNWFAFQFNHPTSLYLRANWNFNWWQYWTTDGLPTERAFNTNIHAQMTNRWWVHAGGTMGQLGSTFCDFDCTRGGPAVRQDKYFSPWAGLEGDDRHMIVPQLWVNYNNSNLGRSEYFNINPYASIRVSSNFTPSIGINLTRNRNDQQSYDNFTDAAGITHYKTAHLEQREASIDLRFDYTMTRTLSLQVYAQPFISKGTYSNVRELSSDPRAKDYDARFQPYDFLAHADTSASNNPAGFNYKQFRSNVVLRWEYRPGSTLYLVWTQGRQDYQTQEGNQNFRGDVHNLFLLSPNNTLLIKASYWISW